MKKLFILLTVLMVSCNENETINEIEKTTITKTNAKLLLQNQTRTNNYDILTSTLTYTKWLSRDEIYGLVGDNEGIRNSLISIFDSKIRSSSSEIQNIPSNMELAGNILCYDFLLKASIKTANELKNMSLDDIKNTIIHETIKSENINNEQIPRTPYTDKDLQQRSALERAQIAYSWWLPKNSEFSNILNKLGNITNLVELYFDLKTSNTIKNSYNTKQYIKYSNNIDVLRIETTNENSYKYVGLYHHRFGDCNKERDDYENCKKDNDFNLYLAVSNDLKNWESKGIIVEHGHQGDIKKFNNGYLIAYEKTFNSNNNNIELQYYDSLENLINKNSISTVVLPKEVALNTNAEGTPDIRNINGISIHNSTIEIGFHYYTGNTDRLAYGILKNFNGSTWKSWKDELSNYNIHKLAYTHRVESNNCNFNTSITTNFKGKIGGRQSFIFNNKKYTIQEAQGYRTDSDNDSNCVWESWRLLLGNGAYFYEIDMKTPQGSFSFANPGIIQDGNDYIITSLLPSQNNNNNESGDLIYKINF